MGGLTRNRKRDIDYRPPALHLNQSYTGLRFDNPIAKKLKFSDSMSISALLDRPVSSKNAAYRLQQYPASINRISRQVHAPCGNNRFGRSRVVSGNVSRREDSVDFKIGSCHDKFEKAKNEALGTLRFVGKGKDVIDVDDYREKEQENVWEDLSVDDVEIVENGKESWREDDGKLMDVDRTTGDRSFQPSCSSVVSEDLPKSNLKSESAGKVLDVVPMDQDFGMPRVSVYRKLYDSAGKHDKKLADLSFQIEVNMKHLSTVRLQPTAKKPTKEVAGKELFVPLTEEEQNAVNLALSNASRRKILVTHENSNIEITGELLRCLRPGAWLNDEVINVYFELLKEREKRNPKSFLKCHFFNTFFYKKLIGGKNGYDFKSVRRWTTQRKLGYCLIECDKIFVPIHKETHWCLAVINKRDEKFQYLDSLKGGDRQVMKFLTRYIVDEVNDKTGKVINVSSWQQEYVEDLPEQKNGYDCGVFMIKYADFYSRDVGLCFDQKHMQYFRQRTAKEILRLQAD